MEAVASRDWLRTVGVSSQAALASRYSRCGSSVSRAAEVMRRAVEPPNTSGTTLSAM
jgi:hypothetical protein